MKLNVVFALIFLSFQVTPLFASSAENACEDYRADTQKARFDTGYATNIKIDSVWLSKPLLSIKYPSNRCPDAKVFFPKRAHKYFEEVIANSFSSSSGLKLGVHIRDIRPIKKSKFGESRFLRLEIDYYLRKKESWEKVFFTVEDVQYSQVGSFDRKIGVLLRNSLIKLIQRNPFSSKISFIEDVEREQPINYGAYRSWEDFLAERQFLKLECRLKEIKEGGYTNYKFKKCESRSVEAQDLFALHVDGNTYINSAYYYKEPTFLKLDPIGNGYYLSQDVLTNQSIAYLVYPNGLLGGAIAGHTVRRKCLLLFDPNGTLEILTHRDLKEKFKEFPELFNSYKRDYDNLSMIVRKEYLLTYLKMKNIIPL